MPRLPSRETSPDDTRKYQDARAVLGIGPSFLVHSRTFDRALRGSSVGWDSVAAINSKPPIIAVFLRKLSNSGVKAAVPARTGPPTVSKTAAKRIFLVTCLGRRDELVLPGGHSTADLVSATLLKILNPFNTSVTWETRRNDVAAAGRMAHAVPGNIFHCWRSRSGLSNCSGVCASPCCQFGCCRSSYPGTIATPATAAGRRSSASVVAKGKRNRIANARYAAS
jgi:hypothetical protein